MPKQVTPTIPTVASLRLFSTLATTLMFLSATIFGVGHCDFRA